MRLPKEMDCWLKLSWKTSKNAAVLLLCVQSVVDCCSQQSPPHSAVNRNQLHFEHMRLPWKITFVKLSSTLDWFMEALFSLFPSPTQGFELQPTRESLLNILAGHLRHVPIVQIEVIATYIIVATCLLDDLSPMPRQEIKRFTPSSSTWILCSSITCQLLK